MSKVKKILRAVILFLLIPLCILLGTVISGGRAYVWISICVALLSCVPFFLAFEKKSASGKMLVLSVMVACLEGLLFPCFRISNL